jgi:hypothetical protein
LANLIQQSNDRALVFWNIITLLAAVSILPDRCADRLRHNNPPFWRSDLQNQAQVRRAKLSGKITPDGSDLRLRLAVADIRGVELTL